LTKKNLLCVIDQKLFKSKISAITWNQAAISNLHVNKAKVPCVTKEKLGLLHNESDNFLIPWQYGENMDTVIGADVDTILNSFCVKNIDR
jgi:hypothetical protein